MVAASPTAQFHRPCVQLASASPRNRNGVSSWACGDVNRQWECTGDFTPHAQAFHRGNVSRVNPSAPFQAHDSKPVAVGNGRILQRRQSTGLSILRSRCCLLSPFPEGRRKDSNRSKQRKRRSRQGSIRRNRAASEIPIIPGRFPFHKPPGRGPQIVSHPL